MGTYKHRSGAFVPMTANGPWLPLAANGREVLGLLCIDGVIRYDGKGEDQVETLTRHNYSCCSYCSYSAQ